MIGRLSKWGMLSGKSSYVTQEREGQTFKINDRWKEGSNEGPGLNFRICAIPSKNMIRKDEKLNAQMAQIPYDVYGANVHLYLKDYMSQAWTQNLMMQFDESGRALADNFRDPSPTVDVWPVAGIVKAPK